LHGGLGGDLAFAPDGAALHVDDFQGFARESSTFPWVSHAVWFYSQMLRWGQLPRASGATDARDDELAAARRVYRPDLYRGALQSMAVDVPSVDCKREEAGTFAGGGFFDGRVFDADDVAGYLAVDRSMR